MSTKSHLHPFIWNMNPFNGSVVFVFVNCRIRSCFIIYVCMGHTQTVKETANAVYISMRFHSWHTKLHTQQTANALYFLCIFTIYFYMWKLFRRFNSSKLVGQKFYLIHKFLTDRYAMNFVKACFILRLGLYTKSLTVQSFQFVGWCLWPWYHYFFNIYVFQVVDLNLY